MFLLTSRAALITSFVTTSAPLPRASSAAATRTACRKFLGLSELSVLNWRCAAVSTIGLSVLTVRCRK